MWDQDTTLRAMWTPFDKWAHFRNLLESPIQYRKNPELFRNPKIVFPYMNLYLRTIPKLLVMSQIQSETPNNIRSPSHIPYLLKLHRTLSVSPYGSRMMQT